MKLSIIFNVYNSHKAVARQLKYLNSLSLPDDIEIIIVDDGSNPPLKGECKNLTIHYTNDKRPWTQGIARNAGAKIAKGEYLFMTDIDHIVSKEAIMDCYNFTGDKMIFPRYLAVILEDGTLTQDLKILEEYGGLSHPKRGLYASYHGNTWCMKKETFDILGGYPEEVCVSRMHPGKRHGEDSYFNSRWNKYAAKKNILPVVGSRIYIFPVGRFHKDYDLNPHALFHELSYEHFPQPDKK